MRANREGCAKAHGFSAALAATEVRAGIPRRGTALALCKSYGSASRHERRTLWASRALLLQAASAQPLAGNGTGSVSARSLQGTRVQSNELRHGSARMQCGRGTRTMTVRVQQRTRPVGGTSRCWCETCAPPSTRGQCPTGATRAQRDIGAEIPDACQGLSTDRCASTCRSQKFGHPPRPASPRQRHGTARVSPTAG